MRRALVGSALLWLASAAAPAGAHQFAPALLELEEHAADDIAIHWKQPAVRVMGSELQPVLPAECEGLGEPSMRTEGTGMRASWRIRCPGGLAGKTVGVDGIATSRADVLLRVTLADGREQQAVLTADTPSYPIRGSSGRLGVTRDYIELGLHHILAGWDHLLFVLGLVFLVRGGKRLLWTITAFTLGHSVTLALASLGVVNVPQAPVEIIIALSIYVLAVELVRQREDSLMQRAPWLVASGFGLLHGLGFAGALREVGLPAAEIPLSLFAFNVGIELGQLLFIAVLLVAGAALAKLELGREGWVYRIPAYGIGSFAMFWVFERLFAL
ncbi:MAG: HupE/UreJ family protein [Holophagales bacterium]|nr:HupE/UreJ family protein [Holophagales bacterium]